MNPLTEEEMAEKPESTGGGISWVLKAAKYRLDAKAFILGKLGREDDDKEGDYNHGYFKDADAIVSSVVEKYIKSEIDELGERFSYDVLQAELEEAEAKGQ